MTAGGIALRAGMIYTALIAVMHPGIFGLRESWLYSLIAVIEQPFTGLIGLAQYPLQGEFVFRVIVSILGAALWWRLDRKRQHDATLREVFLLQLRFVLAAAMIAYGLAKVLHVQMPTPTPPDWIRPIREMHPLYYVDVWMGASHLYQTALGCLELVGGLLLMFRRTTTLGALIALGLVGNQVPLLIGFDDIRAGTYWEAIELTAMACVLVFQDLRRLVDVIFFDERPTAPAITAHAWPARWVRRVETPAKAAFVAALFAANWPTAAQAYDARYHGTITGVYTVEHFSVDGQPASAGDAGAAWRLVAIDDCRRFAVRTVDDRQVEGRILLGGVSPLRRNRACAAKTAALTGTLTLALPDPLPDGLSGPGLSGSLRFSRSGPGLLDIEGQVGNAMIVAHLRRVPDRAFTIKRWPGMGL